MLLEVSVVSLILDPKTSISKISLFHFLLFMFVISFVSNGGSFSFYTHEAEGAVYLNNSERTMGSPGD